MNKTFFIAAGAMLASNIFAQTTNFSSGHLVVSAVDITISGSGASGPVSLKEFDLTPASGPVSVVSFPSSGAGRFVYPWNTNSGLHLNLNAGFFTISGYDTDSGVLGVSSSLAATTPRLIAKIPVSGTVTLISNNAINSGNTPRSVITDGTNFWSGGSGTAAQNGGVQYILPNGANTRVSDGSNQNVRHVNIFNGDLVWSTGGGGQNGLLKQNGLPTALDTPTQLVTMSGGSPYDFVFTNSNTLYVADDRTLASGGGIHKFTFDGSAWNLAYVISTPLPTGCRGITFLGNDGSGFAQLAVITNETVNTTTLVATTPSKIFKVVDGGSDALSTSTLLQTAPSNQNFRGIRYLAGAANQTLSGTLSLADTVGTFANSSNISFQVKQGVNTLASGTLTRTASSSALSINVPAANTGAAQLILDGSPFLRRVININLTGSNQAIGTVVVKNGDVDNTAEVDAADIDLVILNFGDTSNISSDVNRDGEVDAADIDIVIANFGEIDD